MLAVALLVGAFTTGRADQFDNICAAGVLRVAVSHGNPPLSFVNPLSRTIIGYDIDFVRSIAAGIGIELQLVVATSADRVAMLQPAKVDLIVEEMTITPERAKTAAFSIPYFVQRETSPRDLPPRIPRCLLTRLSASIMFGSTDSARRRK